MGMVAVGLEVLPSAPTAVAAAMINMRSESWRWSVIYIVGVTIIPSDSSWWASAEVVGDVDWLCFDREEVIKWVLRRFQIVKFYHCIVFLQLIANKDEEPSQEVKLIIFFNLRTYGSMNEKFEKG